MKVGDSYQLNCKHTGKVAGVYKDGIAVKGVIKNHCHKCCRQDEVNRGYWYPIVFIIKNGE